MGARDLAALCLGWMEFAEARERVGELGRPGHEAGRRSVAGCGGWKLRRAAMFDSLPPARTQQNGEEFATPVQCATSSYELPKPISLLINISGGRKATHNGAARPRERQPHQMMRTKSDPVAAEAN